jgi:predicted outer membrane protein
MNKKQIRILIAFVVVVLVAVFGGRALVNFKPGPSAQVKKAGAEIRAIYELDTQLVAAARLGVKNSDNTRVLTFATELQDFAQFQKQTLHDWFNTKNLKIDEVTSATDLTLGRGYLQQMSNKKLTVFDELFKKYLDDLIVKLATIDTKTQFVDPEVAKAFKEVKGEVSGVRALIG